MQTYQNFIGIDVSKDHLDIAVFQENKSIKHQRIVNNLEAIKKYLSSFQELYEIKESLFCMEHTGIYINWLLVAFSDLNCAIWVENALQIKRSGGANRGKNDKVDAERIAVYAFRFQDKVNLYCPPSEQIEALKTLQTLRKTLVNHKQELETYVKEQSKFSKHSTQKLLEENSKTTLEHLTQRIKELEEEMNQIIKDDPQLKELYRLATSVTGVGKVTAIQLLVATDGFTKFDTAKQLACYCGVVPFENSSGKFKGKARVSKMANKKLKTALHMCALSALKVEGELRTYYLRKVAEGKNKMSVINALRNKIIQRVFACVKNKMEYDKNGINFNNFSKG
jgi:transposase